MISADTISYVGDGSARRGQGGPQPYIVLAMETQRPVAPPALFSLEGVDEIMLARGIERSHARIRDGGRSFLHVHVPDAWMSSEHARIVRTTVGWMLDDRKSKNGTFVAGVRARRVCLRDGDMIETGSTVFIFRHPEQGGEGDDLAPESLAELGPLTSFSRRLQAELQVLPRIASSQVPVLISGETGTGKEVIARAVHDLSGRSGAFIAVNCGALPDSLIESELFGVKKGAFSGATDDREGLVRASDGGTLFLDEIAELPESSQTALLRVLQEGEVTPIGGTRPVKVDIRVLSATHQDLKARVNAGRFRADLYGRLAGYQVRLPPLRDRREDIGLLVGKMLPLIATRPDKVRISREAARRLFGYKWPLNVRELKHALDTAVALSGDSEIALSHLPEELRAPPKPEEEDVGDDFDPDELRTQERNLRQTLMALLEQHGGNVSAVAREMGKERVQIRRWCKRLNIDLDGFR